MYCENVLRDNEKKRCISLEMIFRNPSCEIYRLLIKQNRNELTCAIFQKKKNKKVFK